jgi:hypothetical protein
MDATWMTTTNILIDTAMTNLDHHTDLFTVALDCEVVTLVLVAAKYFANNNLLLR